jgi:hypothetical protein
MNRQQYERAAQLRASGVRVDEEVFEQARAHNEAITILQVPKSCKIYEARGVPEGGTFFEARVCVKTNEGDPIIRLRDHRIILWSTPIELLSKGSDGCYRSFDERPHPIDAHDVLNDLLRGGKLFPPEEREGYILGYCANPIPTEYGHGHQVPATLWIVDSRGDYKFELTMTVIRRKPVTRQNRYQISREPLLARRDPVSPAKKS